MIKAIIFDMDGVLIDSTKYVWKSYNVILEKEGVHIDQETMERDLGRPLKDFLEGLKKDPGVKDIDPVEFDREASELQIKFMKEQFENNSDLVNLMKNLKEKNLKLAVATSSFKGRAEKILSLLGIRDYFDVVVTMEDVTNHKPHPDVFLKAAEGLGVSPEECVVIEDAVSGISAAKRGNMKVVALLTEFQSREELKEADLIIESLDELNGNLIIN